MSLVWTYSTITHILQVYVLEFLKVLKVLLKRSISSYHLVHRRWLVCLNCWLGCWNCKTNLCRLMRSLKKYLHTSLWMKKRKIKWSHIHKGDKRMHAQWYDVSNNSHMQSVYACRCVSVLMRVLVCVCVCVLFTKYCDLGRHEHNEYRWEFKPAHETYMYVYNHANLQHDITG